MADIKNHYNPDIEQVKQNNLKEKDLQQANKTNKEGCREYFHKKFGQCTDMLANYFQCMRVFDDQKLQQLRKRIQQQQLQEQSLSHINKSQVSLADQKIDDNKDQFKSSMKKQKIDTSIDEEQHPSHNFSTNQRLRFTKRYAQTYDRSYSQRKKHFGYSFEEVELEREQQYLKKQKNFWEEFKRLICCRGGNYLEQLQQVQTEAVSERSSKKTQKNQHSKKVPSLSGNKNRQNNIFLFDEHNSPKQVPQQIVLTKQGRRSNKNIKNINNDLRQTPESKKSQNLQQRGLSDNKIRKQNSRLGVDTQVLVKRKQLQLKKDDDYVIDEYMSISNTKKNSKTINQISDASQQQNKNQGLTTVTAYKNTQSSNDTFNDRNNKNINETFNYANKNKKHNNTYNPYDNSNANNQNNNYNENYNTILSPQTQANSNYNYNNNNNNNNGNNNNNNNGNNRNNKNNAHYANNQQQYQQNIFNQPQNQYQQYNDPQTYGNQQSNKNINNNNYHNNQSSPNFKPANTNNPNYNYNYNQNSNQQNLNTLDDKNTRSDNQFHTVSGNRYEQGVAKSKVDKKSKMKKNFDIEDNNNQINSNQVQFFNDDVQGNQSNQNMNNMNNNRNYDNNNNNNNNNNQSNANNSNLNYGINNNNKNKNKNKNNHFQSNDFDEQAIIQQQMQNKTQNTNNYGSNNNNNNNNYNKNNDNDNNNNFANNNNKNYGSNNYNNDNNYNNNNDYSVNNNNNNGNNNNNNGNNNNNYGNSNNNYEIDNNQSISHHGNNFQDSSNKKFKNSNNLVIRDRDDNNGYTLDQIPDIQQPKQGAQTSAFKKKRKDKKKLRQQLQQNKEQLDNEEIIYEQNFMKDDYNSNQTNINANNYEAEMQEMKAPQSMFKKKKNKRKNLVLHQDEDQEVNLDDI